MRTGLPLSTLLAGMLMTIAATAQPFVEVKKVEGEGVEFYLTNHGLFGYNVADDAPGLSYRTESGPVPYLKGAGLWFVGRRQSGESREKLAFVTFDPTTGRSWGAPGIWSPLPPRLADSALYRIYDSREHDRETGRHLGGDPAIPAWPLWINWIYGEPWWAEYQGRPSRPGWYVADPERRTPDSSGNAAIARHVDQFFSRYHDGLLEQYGGANEPGHPIGLQIEQNIYSGRSARNHLIVHYTVVNVSDDTLRDCYLASMVDPNIGGVAANDHTAYIAADQSGYAWSDVESSGDPGTLAHYLLEGPFVDVDQRNPSYRFVASTNRMYNDTMIHRRLGVQSFRTWTSDPGLNSSEQRYDFMAVDQHDIEPAAGDQKMLMTVGPFHMRPGDTAILAVAIAVLPDLDPASEVVDKKLQAGREIAEILYKGLTVAGVGKGPEAENRPLNLHPNPARDATRLALHSTSRAAFHIRLVDALGRVVLEHRTEVLEPGDRAIDLDLSGLASGVYLMSLESQGTTRSQTLVISR